MDDDDVDRMDGRDESSDERSDRNWSEILQELRVTQTGTQIISGFLLTLAFQQRFLTVTVYERNVYLVLISLAAVTTAVGLAPVSLHRTLFRRHEKFRVVSVASRLLDANLVLVALLTGGVVLFIFTFVLDVGAGIVAGAAVFLVLLILLVVIPRRALRRRATGVSG